MSGQDAFPPPGWQPPPPGYQPPPPGYRPPPPGWQPPPPPGWQPHPQGYAAPVHRPGAIPLRPLGLGDLYDGAFKIIRHNPKATVGSAALVSALAMFVPTGITVLLALFFDLSSSDEFGRPMSEADVLVDWGGAIAIGTGVLLEGFGLIFVTGMVAIVTEAAAAGRKLGLGEAWALTRGRRWRLVGLSVLNTLALAVVIGLIALLIVLVVLLEPGVLTAVLLVVVLVPLLIALGFWVWIRLFYLPVPAMMIERSGIFTAYGRGFRLTESQFWRTLGIALLTGLITWIATQLLSLPVSLPGSLAPRFIDGNRGAYVFLLSQALGTVLAASFVTPFAAAVSSLQYVDQRIRKEAYDVELLGQAGISTP